MNPKRAYQVIGRKGLLNPEDVEVMVIATSAIEAGNKFLDAYPDFRLVTIAEVRFTIID